MCLPTCYLPKLGFTGAWTPPRRNNGGRKKAGQGNTGHKVAGHKVGGKPGLELQEIAHLQDLVRLFTEARGPRLAAARGPESG